MLIHRIALHTHIHTHALFGFTVRMKSCNVVNFHILGIRSNSIQESGIPMCARIDFTTQRSGGTKVWFFSSQFSFVLLLLLLFFEQFFCVFLVFLYVFFFRHLCSMHVSMCLTTLLRPRLGTWNADKLNESIYTTSNEIHCASSTKCTHRPKLNIYIMIIMRVV